MRSVLVVYASRTGCAAEVAQHIGKAIATAGGEVDVRAVDDSPSPSGYDAVIVGSGVRNMRWYKPAADWVERNVAAAPDVPVGLFSVGLTPVRFPQLERRIAAYTFSLLVKTGVVPVSSANFKGCFDPSKLSAPEIALVHAMGVPEGDYREWDVIEAWAREAAEKLGVVVKADASRR